MADRTRRQVLRSMGCAGLAAVSGCSSPIGTRCRPRTPTRWTVDGSAWSPPVKRNEYLLVSEYYGATGTGMLSRIVCLRTHDGQEQWLYNVRNAGAGIPRVHDGNVYVGTGTDHVYAFGFETGHRKWRYDAEGRETYGGGSWGQPVVVGDVVIVGISHSNHPDPNPANSDAYVHRIVALNTADGSERWARTMTGMVWAGPVRVDKSVIAVTRTGRIHRLDAATGESVWTARLGDEIRARPIVSDGAVYVAARRGAVASFDLASAEQRWRSSVPGHTEAVTSADDLLLVGDDTGAVTAIAKASGRDAWQHELRSPVAAVAVHADSAWVLTHRGVVHRIAVTTGSTNRQLRVAENVYDDYCGWRPTSRRASGLTVDDDALYVTGPWIGRVAINEHSDA